MRLSSAGGVAARLRAAGVLGRLLGRGLLSIAECDAALTAAAEAGANGNDVGGLRIGLAHALRDTAREEVLTRARAARFVAAAVRAGMRAGLDGAGLRAAAARANRGVLDAGEIAQLAAGQICPLLDECRVLPARGR